MDKITKSDIADIIYRALKLYEGPDVDDVSFSLDGEHNSPEIIISVWDNDGLRHFAISQNCIKEKE